MNSRPLLARAPLLLLSALLAHGCSNAWPPAGEVTQGLAPTKATGGPTVRYEPTAKPLPEIPLPNNAATRLDPTSPTGRRLNISLEAPTALERKVRRRFNELDGFGVFSPIFVSFDAPLDLDNLVARHQENDDFRDDAVLLLNVDPTCERYGEEVALDMGQGRFPASLYRRAVRVPDPEAPQGYRLDERKNMLFEHDPMSEAYNLLFRDFSEDEDGDGQLAPHEDYNANGRLDVANFLDPEACDALRDDNIAWQRCVAQNLLTFYERETNTLILRPVWPLQERCTHAVVLTDRLTDPEGRAVQSPFPGVNPLDQTGDLAPLGKLLDRYGMGVQDVAFAWTFTTGTMTQELLDVRAGLHGQGPFARLGKEFPVQTLDLWTRQDLAGKSLGNPSLDQMRHFPAGCSGASLALLYKFGYGEWDPNMCAHEHDNLAMGDVFGGTFDAPDLLVDRDGRATPEYPDTVDEKWDLDARTGELAYGRTQPNFWCSVPAQTNEDCSPGNPDGRPFCKPFPVVLYAHGYGSSRGELISHMGRHNAMGVATCAINSYGHGFNRLLTDPQVRSQYALTQGLFRRWYTEGFADLIARGRDRDLNNDGLSDPGADMWTADIFHTRDMVRQSALEYMQFVRILRSCDGQQKDAQGRLLCDYDGDGTVDLGGPHNTLGMWGISLGGIIAGVLAGAEPALDAVSPNAAGAGLTDITTRSAMGGLPEAVLLPMTGPVLVGCLPVDRHQRPLQAGESTERDCLDFDRPGPFSANTLAIGVHLNDASRYTGRFVGAVEGVMPGDRVVLENLANGERGEGWVSARGSVRVAVAGDALSPAARRPLLQKWREAQGLGAYDPVPAPSTAVLGDVLRLIVFRGTSAEERGRLEAFGADVSYLGTIYPAGAPLVALMEGFGYARNTPDFRRFLGFAQTAIDPADPAVWASYYRMQSLDKHFAWDPTARPGGARVLVMPTAGDNVVPVNTGIALGRAAGLLGSWRRSPGVDARYGWRELFLPDPRLGMSKERYLLKNQVVLGDPFIEPFSENPVHGFVVYDVENISRGEARFSCGPSDWSGPSENGCPDSLVGQEVFFGLPHPASGKELQAIWPRDAQTFDAMRIPVLRPAGQHGIYNAQPFRAFDADAWSVNYTVRFLATGGARVDSPQGCDCSAAGLGTFALAGQTSLLRGVACAANEQPENPNSLKVCDAGCAAAWGMQTPEQAACAGPRR